MKIRYCIACRKTRIPMHRFICNSCLIHMEKVIRFQRKKISLPRTKRPMEIAFLLEWERQNWVKNLVYSLKDFHPWPREIRQIIAVKLRCRDDFFRKKHRLLVSPPKQKGRLDHARALVDAIGSKEIHLGLSRLTNDKQRGKSRMDRGLKTMDFHGTPPVRPVFIDDVITTGATIEAAWESMGRPKSLKAFSFIYRPPRYEIPLATGKSL